MSEWRRFQALVPAACTPGIRKTSSQLPSPEIFPKPEHIQGGAKLGLQEHTLFLVLTTVNLLLPHPVFRFNLQAES